MYGWKNGWFILLAVLYTYGSVLFQLGSSANKNIKIIGGCHVDKNEIQTREAILRSVKQNYSSVYGVFAACVCIILFSFIWRLDNIVQQYEIWSHTWHFKLPWGMWPLGVWRESWATGPLATAWVGRRRGRSAYTGSRRAAVAEPAVRINNGMVLINSDKTHRKKKN